MPNATLASRFQLLDTFLKVVKHDKTKLASPVTSDTITRRATTESLHKTSNNIIELLPNQTAGAPLPLITVSFKMLVQLFA